MEFSALEQPTGNNSLAGIGMATALLSAVYRVPTPLAGGIVQRLGHAAGSLIGLAPRKEILRRRGVFGDASVRPPARRLPPSMSGLIDAHLAALPTAVSA